MKVTPLDIPDVVLFTPERFADNRGFFAESFRLDIFQKASGTDIVFVQDNHLFSREAKTIRGFHYQGPPKAQGKLVRVLQGAIIDFALDVRANSPTYGKFVEAVLSAENGCQLWLPAGFAHGFMTLEPNTHVLNKVSDYYWPASDGVVAWDDPDVGAPWPLDGAEPILSDKDRRGTKLKDLVSPFR
ncbi:dTDP-4-dehydrorhamnose 3,5-epimerase [Terrihabitans soli]|uniref:dTDP-4-dehydrorhamnose 3,5-epimerase n=1 Tax=Terrihabitans soli TaxID=708113 RepID=A0A6S6QRN0_9HYPH|nr:dTDP-4-dehydrorhamnose 3,5-epimerase [Terrihabitans soli]BCJ90607.1 dTDP-4-dehydrorhamnose 3,5-epimerase [Terrihabitans soli]